MEPQDPQMVINQPEQQNQNLFTRLKKRKKTMIVFLLIILAWLGLYLVTLFAKKTDNREIDILPTPQISPGTTPDIDIDKSGWLKNAESYYSFTYPPEADIYKHPNLTRVVIKGENQREGVEYHDAVFLEFHVKQLRGRSLQQATIDEFIDVKEAPAQEIVEDLNEIEILDKQGYFFRERGLVVLDHYFLLLNGDFYLEIVDASNGGQAIPFDVLAKEIIDSLEFLFYPNFFLESIVFTIWQLFTTT